MVLTEAEKKRIEEEEKHRQTPSLNQGVVRQKHGVPALLSFFVPGLGQIVKGELGKGIFVFIGFIIGIFLLVIPGIIVWIWQIVDAYNN